MLFETSHTKTLRQCSFFNYYLPVLLQRSNVKCMLVELYKCYVICRRTIAKPAPKYNKIPHKNRNNLSSSSFLYVGRVFYRVNIVSVFIVHTGTQYSTPYKNDLRPNTQQRQLVRCGGARKLFSSGRVVSWAISTTSSSAVIISLSIYIYIHYTLQLP